MKAKKDLLKFWFALKQVTAKGKKGTTLLMALLNGLRDKSLGDIEGLFEDGKITKAIETKSINTKKLAKIDWEWIDKELEEIENKGVRIITYLDDEYPGGLRNVFDPPAFLYAKGKLITSNSQKIAVVGTRRTSSYGRAVTEALSKELARAGVTIVSGMARGCDSAAHWGALKANGETVAVLGTGIDKVYPKENKALYEEIIKKGLVLSEFPLGTPPLPQNFLQRNRIVSGMSRALLITEAPVKSGAMMTARLALNEGKDVFSVPGYITSDKSSGTNKLIKEGAALVEDANDILSALSIEVKKSVKEVRKIESAEGNLIFDILEDEPLHIDLIASKTGLTIQSASTMLLRMELDGFIEQLPGKVFTRKILL